jgi:plastocyanin
VHVIKIVIMASVLIALTMTSAHAANAITINIKQNAYVQGNPGFDPQDASVKVGEAIIWHNGDTVPHTATSGHPDDTLSAGKLFNTGYIDPGMDSKSIHLNSAGLVHYFCQIHPFIVGKLNAN